MRGSSNSSSSGSNKRKRRGGGISASATVPSTHAQLHQRRALSASTDNAASLWRRQLYDGLFSHSAPSSPPTGLRYKNTTAAAATPPPSSASALTRSTGVRAVGLAFEIDAERGATEAFLALKPVRQPWDTQLTARAFMLDRMRGRCQLPEIRGGLYCDAMRMGKCGSCIITLFADIQRRVASGKKRFGKPYLIVGPSDAVGVWVDEVVATLGPRVLAVERIDADNVGHQQFAQLDAVRFLDRLVEQTDVIITTYSTLSRTRSGIADLLVEKLRYRAAWFDEAHLISNETTQDFRTMVQLRCKSKWYMTGTPIQNDVSSLRAALHLIGTPARQLEKLHAEELVHYARQLTLRRVPRAEGHIEMVPARGAIDTAPWVPRLRPIPVELLEFQVATERLLYDHMVRMHLGGGWRQENGVDNSAASTFSDLDRESSSSTSHGPGFTFTLLSLLQKCSLSPLTLLPAFEKQALSRPLGVLIPPARTLTVVPPSLDESIATTTTPIPKEGLLMEINEEEEKETLSEEQVLRLAVREATYEGVGADAAASILRVANDEAGLRPAIDAIRAKLLPPVSTKEQWICRTLLTHTTDVTKEKVLIFSQWYLPLAHLARLLDLRLRLGVPGAREYVFLHGKVPPEQRERDRKRFYQDPTCGVMLSTLKTNTVSVDLTCANHVVLCDPSWNPMPEFQATSRVFGVKQTRPVTIYRLVIRNTIDEVVAKRADSKVTLDDLLPMSLADEMRDMNAALEQVKGQLYL